MAGPCPVARYIVFSPFITIPFKMPIASNINKRYNSDRLHHKWIHYLRY